MASDYISVMIIRFLFRFTYIIHLNLFRVSRNIAIGFIRHLLSLYQETRKGVL